MATDFIDTPSSPDPEIHSMKQRIARRGRWWIGGSVVGVLLVLWAVPFLVAHSPLRNSILRSMADGLQGEITSGGASFGWFSPVELYDVEVTDDEGDRVLSVPTVVSGHTFRELIWGADDLGHFRAEQPQLYVVLTDRGSNIERVFAHWLETPDGLSCPKVNVEVTDADVTIIETATDKKWKLEDVAAVVNLSRNWSAPMKVQASAMLPGAKGASPISLEGAVTRDGDSDSPTTAGRILLRGDALPLELAEALAQRHAPGLLLSGSLSANLTCEWAVRAGTPPQVLIDGDLAAENLVVSGPQLGNDRLALKSVKLPCRVTRDGDKLLIERLSITCDVGTGNLVGPVNLAIDQPMTTALMGALWQEAYELEAHVDLARLAALLPATLRIREGTRVTAGQLNVDLKHKVAANSTSWTGQAEMTNISAVNQGRSITWQKPVTVTIAARNGADGPNIDQLLWKSGFLELEASGTMDAMTTSSVFSLKELAEQLGQFVDLGGFELAGEGWSHLSWTRDQAGQFNVDGEFQISDLSLGASDYEPWIEDNLVVKTKFTGRSEGREVRRVDSGLVELESRSDSAQVRLLKPVSDLTRAGNWPVAVQAQGQLATWLPRLGPWIGQFSQWNLAGGAKLDSQVTASARQVKLEKTSLVLRQFHAEGLGMTINEREVKVTGNGSYDLQTGRVESAQTDVASTALAVRARNFSMTLEDRMVAGARGELTYSADLARLGQWFAPPRGADDTSAARRTLAGKLQGRMDIVQADRETTAKFDALIEDLALADAQGRGWTERSVELVGAGSYRSADRLIRLQRVTVDSSTIQGNASGEIADLTGSRDLRLSGKMEVDSQKVLDLIRPYVGGGVEIVPHRAARAFDIQVSLADPVKTLVAKGGIGWTGANVYGFQVGSGEVQGTLRDGLLKVAPLDVTVSDGRLTTAPKIHLWPAPPILEVAQGPLLSKVRVSQEMSERGLKYILPVLADVAKAEGRFSVDMDDSQVNLDYPETADVSGRLTVNSMQIEAGPLLRQVVLVVDTLRRTATGRDLRPAGSNLSPVTLRQASVVPFRMVEGRVYHRDLILDFDDVTIRTYGSVGLDQTLSIMAEMPVPQKWIGNNALGSALKNTTIRLPIGGTLKQPKIDERALQQATAQFVRKGAEGAILEGLNRGLRELLPK
jgi:translocation and assembly module TamB